MLTQNGLNIAVRILAEGIARIQIVPRKVDFADSALNRYRFIQEPSPLDVQETQDGACTTWQGGGLTFRCTQADGLFSCINIQGKELFRMTGLAFGSKTADATFQAKPDEDWVGFGDLTRTRLYHRGYTATCWVSNVLSYLPVPFFMSTEGYGIVVNTTHYIHFDMAKTLPDAFFWQDERRVVDFYVFAAPTFKGLLRQYEVLTGAPKLPPEWAFGLWYICRTQANDAEVMNDAVNLRREGIPCDLIGLEPGWMETCYDLSTEKNWSTERFPLPDWQLKEDCRDTFIRTLKRMGYHLELWLCNDYDLSYEEERKVRKALPEKDIHQLGALDATAEEDLHLSGAIRFDKITKPEEPWFQHLKKFVDWGADFFKQDGAFQVCAHPDRLFGNGMVDAEMHNLYPLLYSRQMWEGFAEYTHRRPVVFTPCGWIGFQSWSGTWTGDTGGRLVTLGAMLNTAMVGHCWATNDMEVTEAEGVHFGYLQPWSQINSWSYFRMPWLQGDKLLAMHRRYAQLRSTLIPYIYSSAREATISALPLLRPLTLEFQDDRRCRDILHEYLLGNDLLVTIYRHDIYLPEGAWKDYWTGKTYPGETDIQFDWPEEYGGGLFVRRGAIIPFGPLMQYRHEKPLDEIRLYLFPDAKETRFALYEDDGVSFDYQNGVYVLTEITQQDCGNSIRINIADAPGSAVKRWICCVALEQAPARITVNGVEVEERQWDAARQELTFPAAPGEILIEV